MKDDVKTARTSSIYIYHLFLDLQHENGNEFQQNVPPSNYQSFFLPILKLPLACATFPSEQQYVRLSVLGFGIFIFFWTNNCGVKIGQKCTTPQCGIYVGNN